MVNMLALPEYKVSNPFDVSPLYNALSDNQRLGQQQRQFDAQNKLQQTQLGLAQNADARAAESHGIQMQSARTAQEMQEARMAAGRVQGIMQLPAEQRAAAWAAARKMPGFSDLPADFDNFEFAAPQILNKAREYMSEKDQAQLGLIRAQTAKAQREAADGGKASLVPVWGKDAQGNDVILQTRPDGTAVQTRLPPGVTPNPGNTSRVDLGTHWGVLDRSGQLIGRLPKDVAGEAAERLRGKETAELQFSKPKAQAALESATAKAGIVREKIKQAIPMVSNWTTGYGAVLAKWPATAARDFKGITDTILANLGFDELQEMRANSPTGGALGQVAVQELEMLQRAKGSIEQAQSPQQVLRVLKELDQFYAEALPRRQRAFERTYAPLNGGRAGAQPQQGGQDMPRPSSPEDAARLPRGTRFLAPDGSIRTVP